MKRYITFLSSVLFLIFCVSMSNFAQEINGSIEGDVKDTAGAVVTGVAITIESKGGTTGFKRSVVSDDNGRFFVKQVPPGLYVVTAQPTAGFGKLTIDNVKVEVGRTLTLPVEVKAGVEAVVDVAATETATIDTTGSQIQTNISAKQIENIPAGVSFDSLLRLSPATRPEGKSGGFQVDGASGSENSFIVDGLDVSNFKSNTLNGVNNIPTTLVQELSVKSSGFDAEFGGATGGVVSVVTKGGSNQYTGSFGTEFETARLNAGPSRQLIRVTNPTTANGNSAEYLQQGRRQGTNFFPTAQFSGPIIKDKLFGLVNYSRQIFNQNLVTSYQTNARAGFRTVTNTVPYASETIYEYAFGRLDANPFNNLRLSGTYLWNPQINNGILQADTISIGGAAPSITTNGQTISGTQFGSLQGGRVNSNNITSQAIYTATNKLIISGRFTRGFLNEKPTSYFVPNTSRIQCSGLTGTLGTFTNAASGCLTGVGFQNVGPNRLTVKQVSIKTNYEVDATYIFSLGGEHQIKGGYANSKIFTDIDGGTNGSNIFTGQIQLFFGRPIRQLAGAAGALVPINPNAIGSGLISRFGTTATGFNRNQSLYIQDKWQPIRRLTINAGVRIEKEFIPTFNGVPVQVAYGFGDKVAPRLGFALDVFGDGKTKIFGSYGKFYDRLKFELPAGSFGGDFFRRDYFDILPGETYSSFTYASILGSFLGTSEGECPVLRAGTRSKCHTDLRVPSFADPDLKPFTQRELTVGVEKEFFSKFLFTGRYTNKQVLNAVEDAGVINALGSEVYKIVNPCKGVNKTDVAAGGYNRCNEVERKYNALQVTLERRFTDGFYFNANYTFSKLFGNYSGLASSDENGRTDPGVSRYFDVPFQGFAVGTGRPDNGRLATDRPHVGNFYGAYTYDWFKSKSNESTISLFTTAQSGTPVTTTVELASNEVILNGRGDLGRTPVFTRSDVAFNHRYRFGRDDRLSVVFNLNVNNIFNEQNVTDYYRLITDVGVDLAFTGTADGGGLGFANDLAGTNAAITGGIGDRIRSVLASSASFVDPRYNSTKPNASAFQAPRNVRFGFRFQF